MKLIIRRHDPVTAAAADDDDDYNSESDITISSNRSKGSTSAAVTADHGGNDGLNNE